MGLLEILLIGAGLAMDAAAVSMTNGMVYRKMSFREYVAMPLFFGVFQAIMPLIGFYAGGLFADILLKYSGIVILLILGIIGGKMIWDGIKSNHNDTQSKRENSLTVAVLFFQAIATSIDAFAVGIAFTAMRVEIIPAVLIIGVTTAVIVVAAILIGKRFGDLLGSKAEVLGGIILVIIGVKALLQ